MRAHPARPEARRLIVNADDFGQSPGINEGIIRCHEHGVLTSASLMVRWPDAAAAAAYARASPALSVGLHIDLGEWAYRNGEWVPLYSVVADDATAVRREITAQLDAFRRLIDGDPTHLDSHQHVHLSAPADVIVAEIGEALGVPVRQRSDIVRYEGSFYGQGTKGEPIEDAISVDRLVATLRGLPSGTTELGCHPGARGDAQGMYVMEREHEVRALCDPRVRAAIDAAGIALVSFRDLAPGVRATDPCAPRRERA